jgi:hypothetical protein
MFKQGNLERMKCRVNQIRTLAQQVVMNLQRPWLAQSAGSSCHAGWHRAWVDGISERAAKGELRTSTDKAAKVVRQCCRCMTAACILEG